MELFNGASDYGTSGLASLADAQSSQTQFDNQAEEAIQNILADVGTRSNVIGSTGYDPRFAQAFNLSRGLIAGNRFDNQGNRVQDLSVPSYLQPQLFGDRVDARGEAIRYYSPVERYLQETAPRQIQQLRNISPVGIMQNLINYGTRKFNETFRDDKKEEKSDVGIMENMDRADLPDYTKAILAGMENTNRNLLPATQMAGLNLKDIKNFISNPGIVGKALDYAQPFLQQMVPEDIKVDTGLIYNPEKPEDSYTGIQFTKTF